MITALTYFLAFCAGGIASELVRMAQDRLSLRQAVRLFVRVGGSPDQMLRIWSNHPGNRCDRPGCPRCRRRWGR
ncbi:hypothetical protein ACFXJ8_21925 [Nonomuraea sp. NPDC059194]|uniref:hypothetical protein n=1 Tax=Nonomuraea sp. NPDC059194 TaxID=3346764 RepID=UPI0036A3549F